MSLKANEGLEVLKFIFRYRKILFITIFTSFVAAMVITSLIPKKYKSTATVFPPAFNSADKMLENPQFGYNIEADRLIQIGQSTMLKDSVIQFFRLDEYYQVDKSVSGYKTRLFKLYDKDVSFERSKFMSVNISVENMDAEMASEIANKILEYLSVIWEDLFKKQMREALDYAGKNFAAKQEEVSFLLDSIQKLRINNLDASLEKLKIQMQLKQKLVDETMNRIAELRERGQFYDFESQVEIISSELVNVRRIGELEKGKMKSFENAGLKNDTNYILTKGKFDGAEEYEKQLKKELTDLNIQAMEYDELSEVLKVSLNQLHQIIIQYEDRLYNFEPYVKSIKLEHLELRLASEIQMLSDLKRRYEQVHRYYSQPLPSIFIVEHALPNFDKSSPSYKMNTLMAVVFSLVTVIVLLLFRERYLAIKDRIKEG